MNSGTKDTIGTSPSTPSRLGADAVLEHEHDHAVGRGDREQVERGGDERHPERAEDRHQQQHAEPDDQRDEERQPAGDLVGQVLRASPWRRRRRRRPASRAWRRGARRRAAGSTRSVVRWSCGELFGITVRTAASPRGEGCGGETNGHARVLRPRPCGPGSALARREPSAGVVAASTSGPLKPGPKPSASRS